jgi:hypothetical protein
VIPSITLNQRFKIKKAYHQTNSDSFSLENSSKTAELCPITIFRRKARYILFFVYEGECQLKRRLAHFPIALHNKSESLEIALFAKESFALSIVYLRIISALD